MLAGLGIAGLWQVASVAAPIGEVKFAHGAATAKQAVGEIRFLGKGMKIEQGDTLTTGQRGFVVLNMDDEGRMTLRPNSEFVIERYAEQAQGESVVVNLVRGGLRSLSGLFAKRRPSSYRLRAGVATIGIRGTEFDVRICTDDCQTEVANNDEKNRRSLQPLVGRVVLSRGEAIAETIDGATRRLAKGGRIYMGDAIVTQKGAFVAVALRDDTRTVIRPSSRFVIDQYYFEPEMEQPSAIFRLVNGGLRALTGALAKRNPRGFRVSTKVATIGIRGTGFDLYADEHCAEGVELTGGEAPADEECSFVNVWDGAVDMNGMPVESGDTGFVTGDKTEMLDETPDFFSDTDAPRPDQLEVDLNELFGTEPADSGEPGIYVSVYDGETFVDTPDGPVDIAVGEAVRIDPDTGDVTRLTGPPPFMINDRYPLPSEFDDRIENAFEFFGDDIDGFDNRDSMECRIN